jgi:endonuclease YncB( thermonuclease family)
LNDERRTPWALALPLVLLCALPAGAEQLLSIGDGDTVTVARANQRLRVRLACIDAPETSQTPDGAAARQALQVLLPPGTELRLRVKTKDRYGRTVAELFRGSTNINQALVASGKAFVYWKYIEGCDRQTYSRLETEARLRRLGVWAVPGGIQRPWDYRRSRREGSKRPQGQR